MSVQSPIKRRDRRQTSSYTAVLRFLSVQGNLVTYFWKISSTSKDINHYRDDIAPLMLFEMEKNKSGKKQLVTLMTAEIKWKFEEKKCHL